MTLKHYLFLLIALLVIGLGGLQLTFIRYLQQQVEQEVVVRSEALSNMAVDVLQETLNSQINEHVVIRMTPDAPPHQPENTLSKDAIEPHLAAPDVQMIIVDTRDAKQLGMSEAEYQQHLSNLARQYQPGNEHPKQTNAPFKRMSRPAEIALPTEIPPKTEMPQVAPDIKIKRSGDIYQIKVEQDGEHSVHRQVMKFTHQDSGSHRYFNNLIMVTLALTLFGLLCAFWLAHKVSQPFLRLNQGFKQLAKGDFGVQVAADGIEDVRLTLQQFNHMSEQLRKLHEMEQRVHQHEQLAEIGEVSRGLAHTLRNPLNTIGLAVEQLCHSSLAAAQKEQIEQQVRQKIQHLDKTIKAMMNLTTQDIDRSQAVDLNQLIQDIVMELRFSSSVTIDLQLSDTVFLKGSESELRTILHSLLSNAVEASEEQDKVTVQVEKSAEELIVHVTDTGHGLAKNIKENLFKPHVSSKADGAGMGLFIAQRLCVSRYSGKITLTDNQPKGCIASAKFPLDPP